MNLSLNEIFYGIQDISVHIGLTYVFVRLVSWMQLALRQFRYGLRLSRGKHSFQLDMPIEYNSRKRIKDLATYKTILKPLDDQDYPDSPDKNEVF